MTKEGSGRPERDGPGDGDRDARLQALLSVDIDVLRRTAEPGPLTADALDADADVVPDEAAREARTEDRPPERAQPADEPAAAPEGTSRAGIPLRSVLSAVVLVALFAAGLVLTYAGTRIIRSSTEGEVLEPVDDPAAPGFEALVEPTPTLAVLHDVAGELDAITVLTLPAPSRGGGGVVFVPRRVIADVWPFGLTPIETAYNLAEAQASAQAHAVGELLTVAMTEVVVVDAERWAGLVAPVAPLTVENPDDLAVDGEVRFPAGEIELAAADVGPYLEARVEGESDLARLYRHETLWRAWLTAVQDAGVAEAVPGELESGIGRFVRTLAEGATALETLPVEDAAAAEEQGEAPVYLPDEDAIAGLVAELVPFPRSPEPGVRPRVRVLNGTRDLDAARAVAPELPPAGVEVVIVGNAASLDHDTTTIAHVGPEQEDEAEEIRDLLGIGEVLVDPRPSDVADITVTLGADHE